VKFAFLCFCIKFVLYQSLEYRPYVLNMFLERVGVDEDVIYVDYDPAIKHVTEDVVNKGLEDRGTVG